MNMKWNMAVLLALAALATHSMAQGRDPVELECPENIVIASCGTAPVPVNYPAPLARTDCPGGATITCTPPSGSAFPPGTNTVTCVATNSCGSRTNCSFTITVVRDTAPPALTCSSNINVATCSPTGIVVNYPAPTVTDDHDRSPTVTCTPPSGSVFPPGTTTVTCVARDACGNQSRCEFLVTVRNDAGAPEIECPQDLVVRTCEANGARVTFPTPRAGDDQDRSPTVTCEPASGSLFPVGSTTVTCTAIDSCGNATSCAFTVTVRLDSAPPHLECPEPITVRTRGTNPVPVRYPGLIAIDDADPAPALTCDPPSGSLFPPGVTTVQCAAVDGCGNRTECRFTVTVERHTNAPDLVVERRTNDLVLHWDPESTDHLEFARDPAGPWHTVPGALPPYHVFPAQSGRFFRLSSGGSSDPHHSAVAASFAARSEANLGTWLFLPQSDWMFTRGFTWTHIRSGARPTAPFFRSMSGHFLAGSDQTPIAVYFSAEAYVDTVDKRMFVRALVDGEPLAPADVVFTTGTSAENPESRAFVFTGVVDRGLHTVEMQWLVDREATAYMRNATFLVRKGSGLPDDRSFYAATPPSGAAISTSSGAWSDVPGLAGSVEVKEGDSLAITVSAESFAQGNGTMFLRALIDGQPASPADVLFAKGNKPQSRLYTFGQDSPEPGVHSVRIQWLANEGIGEVFLADRSLVLAAAPKNSPTLAQVLVTPASGSPETTTSTSFSPMPGMTAAGALPRNGELAVLLSAITSVAGNDNLRVRLSIDGTPVPGSEVQLAQSSVHQGAHTFVFSAKHLYPDGPPPSSTIRVEWRVENGQTASLDDRTMVVLVKQPTVPDLAEPPPMGSSNYPIESQIGTRRLLVICWDPKRPGHPAPVLNAVREAVFGAGSSVRHFLSVASGGKYTLDSALGGTSVLGWYDAAGDWSNYFGGAAGCGPDGANPDLRRREMLQRAAQDIDFASFDDNGDGVLDPTLELGVLLVLPNTGPTVDKVRQVYDSNCNPLAVDGVIIPLIAEWLTDAAGDEFRSAAHEIAHLMLWLDDQYYSPGTVINTAAGRLSLMENFFATHVAHPDPLSKLALGWVTPGIVTGEGFFELEDVKLGREIIVLPRLPGGSNDEYYIIENRQDSGGNVLYDKGLFDSGVAVWHVIEDFQSNGQPPACTTGATWATIGNGNARRGLRLLRPSVAFANTTALWSAGDYPLHDTGLVCPGAAPSADVRNALIWADGTPSGFHIQNWSAPGATMSFQIIGP